jgi:hypothetical protein
MQREISAVCIPLIAGDIKFLSRCLQGIKNQTRAPQQIHISVSSCSAIQVDEIRAILENLGMSVNLHPHSHPLLAGANRNRAAAEAVKAGATLLFFFDVDDIMHTQRIEIITRHFEERKDITGILHRFIFGPKDTIDIDYKTIPWRPFTHMLHENAFTFIETPNDFKSQRLNPEIYKGAKSSGMNFVMCSAITVRAEFWQAWPYNEEIKIGEDQDFNSRIADKGFNLSYIPDDLSVYVTTSRTEFDCMCEVCEKLRPIECVPGPIDIEKIIKKRDEIHKRLIYLEQTSKSIKYMTELLHLRTKVKERINELAPP